MAEIAIIVDPKGVAVGALHQIVEFDQKRPLEIGCGDGHLTWRYAEQALHVTAIDPETEKYIDRPRQYGGAIQPRSASAFSSAMSKQGDTLAAGSIIAMIGKGTPRPEPGLELRT